MSAGPARRDIQAWAAFNLMFGTNVCVLRCRHQRTKRIADEVVPSMKNFGLLAPRQSHQSAHQYSFMLRDEFAHVNCYLRAPPVAIVFRPIPYPSQIPPLRTLMLFDVSLKKWILPCDSSNLDCITIHHRRVKKHTNEINVAFAPWN